MLFLAFAVRLRPAMAVLLGLLIGGIVTGGLKTSVAFPRPDHVVQLQTASPAQSDRFDAQGFWRLPTAEARAAVRATPGISYGFPSGHVSAAMAFCLGVALFYRWRLFLPFALIWPLLMGLSRMYLGRHFLADVLAGLAVGVVAAASAAVVLRWLDHPREPEQQPRRLALLCGTTLALAIVTPFTSFLDPENVGRLTGLIWIYAGLTLKGFPVESGRLRHSAGRFVTAVLIYLAISRLANWGFELSGWEDQGFPTLIAAALIFGGSFLGAVALGHRLRWYRIAA
jgi:membrane-associated phospholipid phosphatase